MPARNRRLSHFEHLPCQLEAIKISPSPEATMGGWREGKPVDSLCHSDDRILVFNSGQPWKFPLAEDCLALETPHQENGNDELPAVPQ